MELIKKKISTPKVNFILILKLFFLLSSISNNTYSHQSWDAEISVPVGSGVIEASKPVHGWIANDAINILNSKYNDKYKELSSFFNEIKIGTMYEDWSAPTIEECLEDPISLVTGVGQHVINWIEFENNKHRMNNHCYDPKTRSGKSGHASALGWALGIEVDKDLKEWSLAEEMSLANFNGDKLSFLPTAHIIGSGKGYFRLGIPPFFIKTGIGVTDWLQIEGGFIVIPPIFVDLQGEFKVNLRKNKDKGLNIALGGIISSGGVMGVGEETETHFIPFITFSKYLKDTGLHFGILTSELPIAFKVLIAEESRPIMPFFGIEQMIKSSFLVMGTNLYRLIGEAICIIDERNVKIIVLGGVEAFYKRVTINVGFPLPSVTVNFQLW